MDWKEKLQAWRDFYEDKRENILANNNHHILYRKKIHNMTLEHKLSPIESAVFEDSLYFRVPLYPQYPIFNYFPDFCDPVKKIIVECDGKDFHDEKKDRLRDEIFIYEGYRVFRIKGSKVFRDHKDLLEEIISEVDCYEGDSDFEYEKRVYELKRKLLEDTAFGVMCSIAAVYYGHYYTVIDIDDYDLCVISLSKNRLVDFKIIP